MALPFPPVAVDSVADASDEAVSVWASPVAMESWTIASDAAWHDMASAGLEVSVFSDVAVVVTEAYDSSMAAMISEQVAMSPTEYQ